MIPNVPNPARVLTPTQLNRLARSLLEDGLGLVWLEGEISGFTRAASGHWYFQLKDAQAQLRSVMFRNANFRLARPPVNGDRVLARGRVSLFEARGDFQFLIEHLQPAGLGQILLAFEQLKARLAAEGCFDPERKRRLPATPSRLDLITSAQGAAVHDVLSVLRRRWPALQVRLFETAVQGQEAAREITAALRAAAAAQPAAEVCLLTRGGGAREDLAAFDDEALARAILAHPVPVVAAIGHETDVTIAELVADLRAATPSAAAELVSPDGDALRNRLRLGRQALRRTLGQRLQGAEQRLDRAGLRCRAQSPQHALRALQQRLDLLQRRLQTAARHALVQRRQHLGPLQRRLQLRQPGLQLRHWRQAASQLGQRLRRLQPGQQIDSQRRQLRQLRLQLAGSGQTRVQRSADRLAQLRTRLQGLDPSAILGRGYALVFDQASGKLLPSSQALQQGQTVRLRLRDGERRATVDD
ncbi:MAG: exodeoxyribonuclease VII large subunit [Lysobacterales bacterium]